MSPGLDESARRAWQHHFKSVAADYRGQARMAMSHARNTRNKKDRARWVLDARRLNRSARHLLNFDHGLPDGAA